MFRLEKLGALPSGFLDLRDDVTLFESFMFETSMIRQWIKNGRNQGP